MTTTTATTSVSSSGGITVSGVGSGIDTSSIVEALVNAQKAPKQTQITTQLSTVAAQKSAVDAVNTALTTFTTAIAALNDTTKFIGLAATSANESVATATSSNKAAAGTYDLLVTQLATGSKVTTAAVSGGASTVMTTAATTLSISQGTGTSYSVSLGANTTLSGVRDAINSQLQSKGITANLVTDSTGASRLVLSSTTTGADTGLSMSGVTALDIDGSMAGSNTGAGYLGKIPQDAKYSIDGLDMTSASNTLDSAISGVTINLTGASTGTTPTVITVGSSTDDLKTSVQSFVTAYNALMTTINAQTAVTASGATASTSTSATTTAGALTGDAGIRNLLASIQGQLTKSGSSGSLSIISQLGVSTQSDGSLELDDTKWTAAMTNSAGDVAGLFVGDSGLLSRLTSVITPYTQTGGILQTRIKSYDASTTDLNNQQTDLDSRMDTLTTTLTAKYSAMDTLVAQLNATSTSVMTTLNSLNTKSSD
ncbi:MAG: flagellar filament capping protein FliD [Pseudomonas sp.]|uniref:flagellar filament capping protein FliD n=1 Tax=Pseudomonas abieticivorans TaxID=2931382 RepID=UPI00209AE017|nr:flagellar filament capping protein FliD [Pseudomonas sp. PIA16]MDE1164314.1 flagellar filament capping protein FliD [Pseudomonas sp.]